MPSNELRKHYFLDRWVIISEGRTRRPHEIAAKRQCVKSSRCPFCPGNERLTPPEKYALRDSGGKWQVRVGHEQLL